MTSILISYNSKSSLGPLRSPELAPRALPFTCDLYDLSPDVEVLLVILQIIAHLKLKFLKKNIGIVLWYIFFDVWFGCPAFLSVTGQLFGLVFGRGLPIGRGNPLGVQRPTVRLRRFSRPKKAQILINVTTSFCLVSATSRLTVSPWLFRPFRPLCSFCVSSRPRS